VSSSNKHITITPVAKAVPFDNSTNGFTSTDTQAAIEEVQYNVSVSASPGFTWGRSGNVNSNTWMLNDSVPSNVSGRTIFLNDAIIEKVFVANQDATSGIIIEIYSHDGDEINLTLLGSVTTVATRSNTFVVSFAIALNKQLSMKLSNTSSNGKNLVAGVLIKGSLV